ncbi:MAG: hypothetical protein JW900_02100 [Anaerolineae bacterium]|nr:hypothetical protein [Anaerolineae bacterium]
MAVTSEARRPRSGSEIRRRQKKSGDAVQMRRRRHGYFPHIFVWRGREYRVQAVERCWTVSRRRWGNQVAGHYFRVRCQEGTFDLFQDARAGTWHMRGSARARFG